MKKEIVLKRKGFSQLADYLQHLSTESKLPIDFVKQMASTFEFKSKSDFDKLESILKVF